MTRDPFTIGMQARQEGLDREFAFYPSSSLVNDHDRECARMGWDFADRLLRSVSTIYGLNDLLSAMASNIMPQIATVAAEARLSALIAGPGADVLEAVSVVEKLTQLLPGDGSLLERVTADRYLVGGPLLPHLPRYVTGVPTPEMQAAWPHWMALIAPNGADRPPRNWFRLQAPSRHWQPGESPDIVVLEFSLLAPGQILGYARSSVVRSYPCQPDSPERYAGPEVAAFVEVKP